MGATCTGQIGLVDETEVPQGSPDVRVGISLPWLGLMPILGRENAAHQLDSVAHDVNSARFSEVVVHNEHFTGLHPFPIDPPIISGEMKKLFPLSKLRKPLTEVENMRLLCIVQGEICKT